jgi:hypothetical protein
MVLAIVKTIKDEATDSQVLFRFLRGLGLQDRFSLLAGMVLVIVKTIKAQATDSQEFQQLVTHSTSAASTAWQTRDNDSTLLSTHDPASGIASSRIRAVFGP